MTAATSTTEASTAFPDAKAPESKTVFVTIDSESTKDVDDAFSLWVDDAGYHLTIAIADPTKLVKAGSEEDANAELLGSTVYVGDRTVRPMLPRRISEGAGSLVAGKDRAAFVFEITLDPSLELTGLEITRRRINVSARLSYEDVPLILHYEKHSHREMIGHAAQLARRLLAKRRHAGAMALYDLSLLLYSDEEGRLRKFTRAEEMVGHVIIQEFMILTNTILAAYMVQKNIPCLFRNHEASAAAPPSDELSKIIETWCRTGAVDAAAAHDKFAAIMGRASYGPTVKGHFGLAVGCYGHFTSPLRRYADLVNLRNLRAFLKEQEFPRNAENLASLATHLNESAERRKEERSEGFKEAVRRHAERAVQLNQLHTLADHEIVTALKLARASADHVTGLPGILSDEVIRRLETGISTDRITDCLVAEVPIALWTERLRISFRDWLFAIPTRAMHLAYHAQQIGMLKSLEFEVTPAATTFTAFAKAVVGVGEVTLIGEGTGPRKRDAEQVAAANLIARLMNLPGLNEASGARPQLLVDKSAYQRNAKSVLLELCQKRTWAFPEFKVEGQGPSHAMVFTATVSIVAGDESITLQVSGARNKREAETLASAQLLKRLEELGLKKSAKARKPGVSALSPVVTPSGKPSNPVGALNEMGQKGIIPPPLYSESQTSVEPPRFEVSTSIPIKGVMTQFSAEASTKHEAKRHCASQALAAFEDLNRDR